MEREFRMVQRLQYRPPRHRSPPRIPLSISFSKVFSEGKVVDTPLGLVKIPMASIATECERSAKEIDAVLSLTDGVGDLHLQVDWVPLDNNLMKVWKFSWTASSDAEGVSRR